MSAPTGSAAPACEFCRGPLRAGSRFCGYCGRGVAAALVCRACGARLPPDFRFCDQCGAAAATRSTAVDLAGRSPTLPATMPPSLLEVAARPQEERRTVTVMFADVTGFTSMSEHLDPEEVKETMNLVFDHLTREVVDQGGTVDKYMGDALMALFGAPRSFGDDAERAARAALRMQAQFDQLAAELSPKVKVTLKLRIGLNTGEVLAGYVGGGVHKSYTVMGDAVNVAERLEANCAAGRVLVSATTQRCIASRFVVERAGTLEVKGRHQAVETFYLVRERRADLTDWATQFEGIPVPHVGRRGDLGALHSAWQRMSDCRRVEAVYVEGGRGLGKTRLIAEFLRTLEQTRPAPFVLHASAGGNEASVLDPVARAVHAFLRQRGGDAASAVRGIWSGGADGAEIRANDSALGMLVEFVYGRLELQADDHVAARTQRRLLVRSVAELLMRLSRTGPTVLVISESHDADDATVELVRELLSSRDHGQLFVILEAEPGRDMERWVPEHCEFGIAHLGVRPLNAAEQATLISAMLAPAGKVPRWVTDWIVPQCEGTPAHVIEHVASLRALGALTIDAVTGAWHLPAERPAGLELPPNVKGALQATLDHLPDDERSVVSVAAVIGRVFWDRALHRLLEGQLEGDQIDAALQILRGRDVVVPHAHSALLDATEWRFRSELLHEVAYSRQPTRHLRELHARAARALEGLGMGGINAVLLGGQWERAEQPALAVAAYLDGAERLAHVYSLEEAARVLHDADRLLAQLVAKGEAVGLPGVPAARSRLIHAEIANARGEYEVAVGDAAAGLQALGGVALGGAGDAATERLRARLHHTIGRSHDFCGRHAAALAEFERAVGVAERIPGESTYVLNLQASIAWSLAELGRAGEAEVLIHRALAPFRVEEIRLPALGNAVARHLDTLGEILRRRNDPVAALGHCTTARKLRELEGNLRLLIVSDQNIAISKALAGDWKGAAESLERVLEQRMSYGDPYDITLARINLAEVLFHVGSSQRALDELGKAELDARRLSATRLLHEIEKVKELKGPSTPGGTAMVE